MSLEIMIIFMRIVASKNISNFMLNKQDDLSDCMVILVMSLLLGEQTGLKMVKTTTVGRVIKIKALKSLCKSNEEIISYY